MSGSVALAVVTEVKSSQEDAVAEEGDPARPYVCHLISFALLLTPSVPPL
ncbi:hypothetical protein ACPF8X_18160 [Streptomyces sp. G35A]